MSAQGPGVDAQGFLGGGSGGDGLGPHLSNLAAQTLSDLCSENSSLPCPSGELA